MYGDEVTDLGLEQWGYLASALGATFATYNFVLFDSPFKSTEDSGRFFQGFKSLLTTLTHKFDTVTRVAKRMAAVLAEESTKTD